MSKTNGTTAAGRRQPPALVKSEHAKTWHIDDGTAPDGSARRKTPVRRSLSAEYKLSIHAAYDACSETGEKGAILRREGLYSSLIAEWKRQHRQGHRKATVGRSDVGRPAPSPSEEAKLRTETQRPHTKI